MAPQLEIMTPMAPKDWTPPTPAEIRRLREAAGWTQAKAAEMAGLGSQVRWAEYESNKRSPSEATWGRVVAAASPEHTVLGKLSRLASSNQMPEPARRLIKDAMLYLILDRAANKSASAAKGLAKLLDEMAVLPFEGDRAERVKQVLQGLIADTALPGEVYPMLLRAVSLLSDR